MNILKKFEIHIYVSLKFAQHVITSLFSQHLSFVSSWIKLKLYLEFYYALPALYKTKWRFASFPSFCLYFSVSVQSRLFPWEIYPGSVSPCLWGGYRHGAQTMYWKWGSVCHLSLLLWRNPGHPFYHISQESTFQKCWNWVQGWNSILNPIAKLVFS